jgi:type IV pilus assembly protein PilV
MKPRARMREAGNQSGSMLLESFIAILIFSMGILAIVGMQASAIKNSTDARYRSEASQLANELLGQMWVSDRADAPGAPPSAQPHLLLQTNFQGGAGIDGPTYTAWLANVRNILPGTTANPPRVSVDPVLGVVTLTVFWKAPNEPAAAPVHSYTITTQMK